MCFYGLLPRKLKEKEAVFISIAVLFGMIKIDLYLPCFASIDQCSMILAYEMTLPVMHYQLLTWL